MAYDRKQIILERSELSEGLGGKYVDLYEFPDGTLEVRSKGRTLPYRVFSKDQRVSHTAIVENKRLSHALTIIKAQQDLKDQPKVAWSGVVYLMDALHLVASDLFPWWRGRATSIGR